MIKLTKQEMKNELDRWRSFKSVDELYQFFCRQWEDETKVDKEYVNQLFNWIHQNDGKEWEQEFRRFHRYIEQEESMASQLQRTLRSFQKPGFISYLELYPKAHFITYFYHDVRYFAIDSYNEGNQVVFGIFRPDAHDHFMEHVLTLRTRVSDWQVLSVDTVIEGIDDTGIIDALYQDLLDIIEDKQMIINHQRKISRFLKKKNKMQPLF